MVLKGIFLNVMIGLLIFANPGFLSARDAPVTTAVSVGVCPGAAAIVPVTVADFTSIGAITLRLDYDPTQLAFDNFSNLNPSISGAAVNHVIVNANLAKILIVWASVNAVTLPDSSKLLDLNFILTKGSPEIGFNNSSNGGGDCEYADENGVNLNDMPSAVFYINSAVTNLEAGAAETITGEDSICAGAQNVVYSVPPVVNATGYLWTVPTGCTIISGDNSPSIMVDYSGNSESGNLSVAGTNSCGTGTPSSKYIIVKPLPGESGTVTGPGIVCAGAGDIMYSVPSVPDATGYDWTLPPGAVITSGAATNQVSVQFGPFPGNGLIWVKGTNACGSGPTSPEFMVTLLDPLDTPVVTATGPLLTSSISTGNQWFYEGTGSIPGATGQTFLATTTGWYWTIVQGEKCPVLESNHVYVLFTGQEEYQHTSLNLYPVPNDGRFSILLTSPSPGTYSVLVYNQFGIKIFGWYDLPVTGAIERQIDIRPAAAGIYSVVFFNGKHKTMRKVLVK